VLHQLGPSRDKITHDDLIRHDDLLRMDTEEILWKLYQDHMAHARHLEVLRASTATVLLAVTAGVLGLLGTSHAWPLTYEQLPLSVFLVLIGFFGSLFAAKYHERISFHINRGDEYRDRLDGQFPAARIKRSDELADLKTRTRHSFLYNRRLWHLWVSLHLLVALLGMVLTASAFIDLRKPVVVQPADSAGGVPAEPRVPEAQDTR
jgi:hypothetical protein